MSTTTYTSVHKLVQYLKKLDSIDPQDIWHFVTLKMCQQVFSPQLTFTEFYNKYVIADTDIVQKGLRRIISIAIPIPTHTSFLPKSFLNNAKERALHQITIIFPEKQSITYMYLVIISTMLQGKKHYV